MSGGQATEFSRVVRRDRVGPATMGQSIAATEEERAALTGRFGLASLDRLEAAYDLTDEDGGVFARGRVRATLAQPCVATGEPVPETVEAPFVLRFVEAGSQDGGADGELEIDADDVDLIDYDGLSIDMGEAVAQTMALAMTPFPRAPDADAYLKDKGVLSEEDAGPFAALKALRDPG